MTFAPEGYAGGALVESRAQQELAGPLTMTQRLEARRDMLAAQLEQTEAALAALNDNPDVARAVDAIAKLGHF